MTGDNDDELESPLTELATFAVQHHEMYTCWVAAGFTPGQAMTLLETVIRASFSGGD